MAKRKTAYEVALVGAYIQCMKDQLSHGQFLTWLDQNMECSIRTAQRYMEYARLYEQMCKRFEAVAEKRQMAHLNEEV